MNHDLLNPWAIEHKCRNPYRRLQALASTLILVCVPLRAPCVSRALNSYYSDAHGKPSF
jgi:hypothetical protein